MNLEPSNEISVSDFEKIRKDCLIFDARSPSEFEEFHIVDAINLPLLDDEARELVGTMYKQKGREEAIAKGFDIVDFDELKKKALEHLGKKKKIIVYCARGGMRSGLITNLIESLGFECFRLIDGIKEYRNSLYVWLDELLDRWKSKFIVLEGFTGTRKTELIKILEIPKLDLEDLAQHRASTFGSVGLKPRSQKMFLFLLYEELLKLQNLDKIIVEGESKKIGKIFLPEKLFSLMMTGDFIHVVASDDTRVKAIIDEYCTEEGVKELISLTPRLEKHIGKNKVKEVVEWFEKKDYDSAVRYLLLEYYDKVYKQFAEKYVFEICTDDLEKAKETIEN